MSRTKLRRLAPKPSAKRKREVLMPVGIAMLAVSASVLGSYAWYLVHIDPHVNGWLVASSVAILVISFPLVMGKR